MAVHVRMNLLPVAVAGSANHVVLQEKQRAVEEAAQAALEASAAAEAQHAAACKQLAADKRALQEQRDQVSASTHSYHHREEPCTCPLRSFPTVC